MDYYTHYESPLGQILLSGDASALTGLWFESPETLATERELIKRTSLPIFEETCSWLDIYFSGKDPGPYPKLLVRGTPFQKEVCDLMLTIPYGATSTYGALAKILSERHGIPRMASQAVGQAVGRNPISIIIPCHRVIGQGGNLTGYGGGLPRKSALLQLEGLDLSLFHLPKNITERRL